MVRGMVVRGQTKSEARIQKLEVRSAELAKRVRLSGDYERGTLDERTRSRSAEVRNQMSDDGSQKCGAVAYSTHTICGGQDVPDHNSAVGGMIRRPLGGLLSPMEFGVL
jgi:hypothetical protein